MMHTNMGQILSMLYTYNAHKYGAEYDAHKHGADSKHAIQI